MLFVDIFFQILSNVSCKVEMKAILGLQMSYYNYAFLLMILQIFISILWWNFYKVYKKKIEKERVLLSSTSFWDAKFISFVIFIMPL